MKLNLSVAVFVEKGPGYERRQTSEFYAHIEVQQPGSNEGSREWNLVSILEDNPWLTSILTPFGEIVTSLSYMNPASGYNVKRILPARRTRQMQRMSGRDSSPNSCNGLLSSTG
jgi:hypothetical protein